ncbi:MAG TPA: MBL fold metallo-hydrolase [Flavisolibacter sp.]|nr:MBL fold metallo-hydrolase [Flavisolibacter sp.]
MNRKIFIKNTALFAGAGLLLQHKAFAALLQRSNITVKMIRDNVGYFTERGGTIGFLLSNDGIVVIDSQFPDTAPHLIDDLKKRSAAPIKFLLNTHHHGDHTGGNIAFKGIVEHVVAHKNALINHKAVTEKNNTADKQLYADLTFDDSMKLKIGREKIKSHYFGPAHTNGDAVYHFQKANIMHLGDLMFNKRPPFVDRSTGANMNNWIKVLDQVIKKSNRDTIYIFGHSLTPGEETGTAEDLKKFQDYLGKVLQFAEQEFKRGVPKEAFIKNTAIPGVTEWSGQGIERPLTAAFEEVSTK